MAILTQTTHESIILKNRISKFRNYNFSLNHEHDAYLYHYRCVCRVFLAKHCIQTYDPLHSSHFPLSCPSPVTPNSRRFAALILHHILFDAFFCLYVLLMSFPLKAYF